MIELALAVKHARLAALRDRIDAGSAGDAEIRLYAGARPAFGGAPAGAMLVSVSLPVPCGTIANGALTLDVANWVNVAASGDIVWGRIFDRDGVVVADLGVGLTGSGQAIEINTLTVFAGGLLAIISAVLRE